MLFFSPLEQFQILPVIPIRFFFDFSITNATIIFLFSFLAFSYFLFHALEPLGRFFAFDTPITFEETKEHFDDIEKVAYSFSWPMKSWCPRLNNFRVSRSAWYNHKSTSFLFLPILNLNQIILESVYLTARDLVRDNVGPAGTRYFPYVFSIFIFILISNVVGLVPYSFTITSHLILTFALALSSFIAINIIGFQKHGLNMFSLFLPPGSSLALAILLVPIEFVSYIFRPISLAVRLFANMMAGHTLLKVIAGFAWVMTTLGTGLWLAHFIPLLILTLLMGLELAVAVIQSYVFTILICIYLNDAIHLH